MNVALDKMLFEHRQRNRMHRNHGQLPHARPCLKAQNKAAHDVSNGSCVKAKKGACLKVQAGEPVTTKMVELGDLVSTNKFTQTTHS